MRSKFDGLILDGLWKYKGVNADKKGRDFVNIRNGRIIALSEQQVYAVMSNKTTVSKIITRRIGGRTYWISNNTVKTFNAQKRKYAKGGIKA